MLSSGMRGAVSQEHTPLGMRVLPGRPMPSASWAAARSLPGSRLPHIFSHSSDHVCESKAEENDAAVFLRKPRIRPKLTQIQNRKDKKGRADVEPSAQGTSGSQQVFNSVSPTALSGD